MYEKRTSVVKETEMEKWSMLSFQYMTEESDDEEPNTIVLHKLTWRSESKSFIVLNKFIDTLDKRLDNVASKFKDGIVAKKVR